MVFGKACYAQGKWPFKTVVSLLSTNATLGNDLQNNPPLMADLKLYMLLH